MPEIKTSTSSENEKSQPIQGSVKSSSLLSFIIQFGFVAIIFLVIGYSLGQKRIEISSSSITPKIQVENKLSSKDQTVDFSLFWQVYESLPKSYVDKSAIDGQKMMYGAISGMVRSLGDPYTAFLDPNQNDAMKSDLAGSYEGVGIQIGFNKEKRLTVISPLDGTPAEAAGIVAKDLILKIGDKDTFDMTLPEAVELIRGQAGTKVKLSLRHEGSDEPYEVEVERAKITVKSVVLSYKDVEGKKIGVVKVTRFGETTNDEWDEAVNRIQLDGAQGVVVDMRNNPGGLLYSAVHLSSEFVTGTVVKQQFSDGSVTDLKTDRDGELKKIPLAVLINGGSASASEIFAGAIKDNKRGKVIGEKSFGKGTVQDAIDLPGGSGLHVTIAKWLTPKGNSIHEVGISPDIEVELTPEDREQQKDPQLERALSEF